MEPDHFVPVRLDGGRFSQAIQGAEVGFPLDVIDELARYDRLVVAVASAMWKAENPGKNLPRRFAETVQMRLTGLEEGSVKSVIANMVRGGGLATAPSWGPPARNAIAVALACVAAGMPVPGTFPESALPLLASVGKGLKADEVAIFRGVNDTEFRYTVGDQRRLHTIVKSNRSANGVEVGRLIGIHADAQSFRFRPRFGDVVGGKFFRSSLYDDLHAVTAKSETAPYVEVTGAFQYDAKGRIAAVDDVAAVRTLAQPDDPMGDEIRRLLELPKGWLDGSGVAPAVGAIEWAIAFAAECKRAETPYPHVFPTAEGGVLLEDQIGPVRWSLEVEPDGSPFIVTAGGGATPTLVEPADAGAAAASLKEFRA